jgi:hypothetical protein
LQKRGAPKVPSPEFVLVFYKKKRQPDDSACIEAERWGNVETKNGFDDRSKSSRNMPSDGGE